MIRLLALLLTVAGCAAQQQAPEKPAHIEIAIPPCPQAAPPPKPLASLVNTSQLREWADATENARQQTAAALKVCARRLRLVTERLQ